jgi:carboxyl-terminal processing protease
MQGCLKMLAAGAVATFIAMCAFVGGFAYNAFNSADAQSPVSVVRSVIRGSPAPAKAPSEFGVFWEVWNIISREFYGKVPSTKEMTYAAIRGAIKTLNDQHTVFLEPRRADQEKEQLRGDFQGIGAQVNVQNNQIVIVAPIPGSPAEKAGIKAGDIIVKVDDKDVTNMSLEDVVAIIRGPRGTKVKVTVVRLGVKDPIAFEITRDVIQTPSVITRLEEGNIGYVRLTIFGGKSRDEVANALKDLKAKGAKAFIFDLRDNPGGYLDTAIGVAGQFIKDGVIAYERGKSGQDKEFKADGKGEWTDGPLVILINKGSASASEIVSGAVQDRKRGTLIGDTSFGKGSVQSVHELSDKSSVHVTIAEWLTPNKTQISGKGLTPDMSIPIGPEDQKRGLDTQLKAAIDYLKGQIK